MNAAILKTTNVSILKKVLCVIVLFLLISGTAVPDERVFEFSGTLNGVPNCDPPSHSFCGPYTGKIRIDDRQIGKEVLSWKYEYTADVDIEFSGGKTASCHARTFTAPVDIDDYNRIRMRYCLLAVTRRAEDLRTVQLSFYPLEKEISSVTLYYEYKPRDIDIADLLQVLDILLQRPTNASLWVVGVACWWGPCVDRSVTQLQLYSSPD